MKVLLVADEESRYIWDHFDREAFRGVELIVSCGDLKRDYLNFLVTMLPVPLVYVPGNHDGSFMQDPPAGCIDLEKRMFVYKGLRFIGFGGAKSPRRAPCHYTEGRMRLRLWRRLPEIFLRRGVDVLVTHAPAEGLGDGADSFHQGFRVFRDILDRYRPRYFIHGHQHLTYNAMQKRILQHGETTVVNAYGHYILDIEEPVRRRRK